MDKRSDRKTAKTYREPKAEDSRYKHQADSLFQRYLSAETGINLSEKAGTEPLANMAYTDEIAAKQKAFTSYWEKGCGGEGVIKPIIVSPKARGYRTTTKRRSHPGRKVLLLPDEGNRGANYSLLEPKQHAEIYARLESLINEPINKDIAKRLNFAIVRGNYESFCVIFNVDALSAGIVKGFSKIGEKLASAVPGVSTAFIYHDPTRSKYYFETTAPVSGLRLKKLFGNKFLSVDIEGINFSFGPTAFSQVNLSIAGKMLHAAEDLLSPAEGSRLIDLYCGYGFFSSFLAPRFDEVYGVDYERSSVESAEHNIKRTGVKVRSGFFARKIDPETLSRIIPKKNKPEYVLLDPPRKGCAPGVIDAVALRSPEKVLHVFCGIETIPDEIRKWGSLGYFSETVQPLDMFPGTPNLEVMVLLSRKPAGKQRR